MKLGFGGFVDPENQNAQAVARVLFLKAVADVAPEVVSELRAQVLPLFKAGAAGEAGAHLPHDLYSIVANPDVDLSDPAFRRFVPGWAADLQLALRMWADRWHLPRERWVFRTALDSLFFWSQAEAAATKAKDAATKAKDASLPSDELDASLQSDEWPTADLSGASPSLPLRRHETIGPVPQWDPATESRLHATKRIHDELDTWIGSVAALAEERGWTQAPTKRRPRYGGSDLLHFEWFARRRVLRETASAIADGHVLDDGSTYDESTVLKATNRLAKALGFDPT